MKSDSKQDNAYAAAGNKADHYPAVMPNVVSLQLLPVALFDGDITKAEVNGITHEARTVIPFGKDRLKLFSSGTVEVKLPVQHPRSFQSKPKRKSLVGNWIRYLTGGLIQASSFSYSNRKTASRFLSVAFLKTF